MPRGAMTPPARRREQALPLRALRRPRPSMRAPHWHWGEATQCFVAGSRAASERVHVRAVTCGHRRWPPGGGIVAAAARASTPAGRAAGACGAECARPAAWLNARASRREKAVLRLAAGFPRAASDRAEAVPTTCCHWREPPGRDVTSARRHERAPPPRAPLAPKVQRARPAAWRQRSASQRVPARLQIARTPWPPPLAIGESRRAVAPSLRRHGHAPQLGAPLTPAVQSARITPRGGSAAHRGRLPVRLQTARTPWPPLVATGRNRRVGSSLGTAA